MISDNTRSRSALTISLTHESINALLVALSVLIAIVPELNRTFNKIGWIAIIMLWYLHTVLFYRKESPFKAINFAVLLLSWFIYNMILLAFGYSDADSGNYFIMLACFDMLIKTAFIRQYYKIKTRERLMIFMHLVLIICVAQNIFLGYTIPRIHFYFPFNPEKYVGMNVAETEFYNTLAFMAGIDIYLLMTEKKTIRKILLIISIALSLFFMLSFEPRTNAMAILILMIFALLLSREQKASNKVLMISLVIISILIAVFFFGPSIIGFLPVRIRPRIEALLSLSLTSISSNMYLGRFDLSLNSLKTFLGSASSFFFGIGYHLGNEYYEMVGQHSQIIDYLAWFGCIGACFLVAYFKGIKKYIVSARNVGSYSAFFNSIFKIYIFASLISLTFRPELVVTSFMLGALISCADNKEDL